MTRGGIDDFRLLLDQDREWQRQGRCRGSDPDPWFPQRGDNKQHVEIAKAICNTCPVQQRCGEYGIANNEEFGVWGGLTGRERRKIRSRRFKEVGHQRTLEATA